MSSFRFLPAVFAAPAVLLLSSFAHAVAAPEPTGCGDGGACAHGFECKVVATSGCDSGPACAPGSACPDPAPCDTQVEYGCAPSACSVDADCASGMVCHEWTEGCEVTDCLCAPGQACDCGEPAACEPKTVSMCTPRYALPCEAAADCGPGFTCEEAQSCGCSGSSGSGGGAAPTPPSAGGAPAEDAAPIPPDCSCEPSGVKQCIAQEIACANDAACPAGWTCEADDPPPSVPACSGDNCGARPAPIPSTPSCQPPYYRGPGGVVGGSDDGPVPENTNGGEGTPTSGTDNGATSGSGESKESSACQFGPASTSRGGLSLLVMLGAMLGIARRRRVT